MSRFRRTARTPRATPEAQANGEAQEAEHNRQTELLAKGTPRRAMSKPPTQGSQVKSCSGRRSRGQSTHERQYPCPSGSLDSIAQADSTIRATRPGEAAKAGVPWRSRTHTRMLCASRFITAQGQVTTARRS